MDLKQLIEEAKKHGIDLSTFAPGKDHQFSIIVRYNRGLGIEYLNLPPVTAKNPVDAQALADAQANTHFQITAGLEKAVVEEVKVRLLNI